MKRDKLKEKARSYINDRNITVTLTGEEHDWIAVMIHHIGNPSPLTEKLAQIFKLEDYSPKS